MKNMKRLLWIFVLSVGIVGQATAQTPTAQIAVQGGYGYPWETNLSISSNSESLSAAGTRSNGLATYSYDVFSSGGTMPSVGFSGSGNSLVNGSGGYVPYVNVSNSYYFMVADSSGSSGGLADIDFTYTAALSGARESHDGGVHFGSWAAEDSVGVSYGGYSSPLVWGTACGGGGASYHCANDLALGTNTRDLTVEVNRWIHVTIRILATIQSGWYGGASASAFIDPTITFDPLWASIHSGNGLDIVFSSVTPPAVSSNVPEPETYAMLLAGLGLLGFMARRRKQNAA